MSKGEKKPLPATTQLRKPKKEAKEKDKKPLASGRPAQKPKPAGPKQRVRSIHKPEEPQEPESDDDCAVVEAYGLMPAGKRCRGRSVSPPPDDEEELAEDAANEFFFEFTGLPTGDLDIKSKFSHFTQVKAKYKVEDVDHLFGVCKRERYQWRPDELPDLTKAEKAEVEDIYFRCYSHPVVFGVMPAKLAWSYTLWRRKSRSVNWFAFAKHALSGQFTNKRVGRGSVRNDWVHFVQAKQAGGVRYLPTRKPMLVQPQCPVKEEIPEAASLGSAGLDSSGKGSASMQADAHKPSSSLPSSGLASVGNFSTTHVSDVGDEDPQVTDGATPMILDDGLSLQGGDLEATTTFEGKVEEHSDQATFIEDTLLANLDARS